MYRADEQRGLRHLKLTASAVAIAASASATGAWAEGAGPDQPSTVQEVVVTGFRSSLAQALNIKRSTTSEVDTILAEDIGKFPDLNLAESLQRIPGVSITREGGEGRQITVRGLGPQYTRVRINGLEGLSTVGSPDNEGGVNRTRAFDFNVFASDLFSSITVRKTAEGDLDEGSLGATVDLHTARPFDFPGFKFMASAKGDYNTLAKTTEPRAEMLISNTWADGKFGALASVSYSHRNFLDEGSSTVRWDEAKVLSTGGTTAAPLVGFGKVGSTNCQVFPLPAACVAADNAFHPRFPRWDDYHNDQTRKGATLSLQWRPNDRNLFTLDGLYSNWHATRQEQYLEAPGFSGTGKCTSPSTCTSIANIQIVSDTIDSNNVMTQGVFNGVDIRVEDRFDVLNTDFHQITLKGEHEFTDRLSVDELIGTSQSNFSNPIQTTLGWDQFNIQNFSYNYATRTPYLNFGSANVTSSGGWVLTSVRERPQTTDNGFNTGQLNAHYKVWDGLTVSAGLNYKEYTFKTTSLRLVNGESVTASNVYSSLRSTPISGYSQDVNMNGMGLKIPAGSTTFFATPDIFKASGLFGLYTNPLFALSTAGDLGNNVSEHEGDYGAYLQADFKFDVLGRPLDGNVGVREVQTRQNSTGYLFISSVLTPVASSRTYENTLPSMNLVWHATDDFQIRLSAAKVMSRPNLTDLVASTSLSVSGTQYSVKTGNPNLKPFLANSYDLAFEWYPHNGAIVSLALFRKDILSLITTNSVNIPFHGNPFGIPDSAAIAACGSTPGCSPAATWNFSTPTNTSGGSVNGAEINYQQPFTFLPGLLSHTGLLLNATAVDSSVNYPSGSTFVKNQLLGLSRYSANGTLYYEDSKWMVRVSGSYRSRFLIRVPGQETGTDADGWNATFNLDTSAQYTVSPHLKLTLEGVNLTDQYVSEFNDTLRNMPYYYHHTGPEVLFGLRYQY
jgi:TonB-dependent receptor